MKTIDKILHKTDHILNPLHCYCLGVKTGKFLSKYVGYNFGLDRKKSLKYSRLYEQKIFKYYKQFREK